MIHITFANNLFPANASILGATKTAESYCMRSNFEYTKNYQYFLVLNLIYK